MPSPQGQFRGYWPKRLASGARDLPCFGDRLEESSASVAPWQVKAARAKYTGLEPEFSDDDMNATIAEEDRPLDAIRRTLLLEAAVTTSVVSEARMPIMRKEFSSSQIGSSQNCGVASLIGSSGGNSFRMLSR